MKYTEKRYALGDRKEVICREEVLKKLRQVDRDETLFLFCWFKNQWSYENKWHLYINLH